MKRIYLDSNILIAHHSTDKAEESKKKMVENALAVFAELKDIHLCTSIKRMILSKSAIGRSGRLRILRSKGSNDSARGPTCMSKLADVDAHVPQSHWAVVYEKT